MLQTVAAMVAPMPAAISAYSIAVAPLSSARKRRTRLPNERSTSHQPRPSLRAGKVQSSVVRCATSGTSAGGIGYSRSRFGRTQASLWPSFAVTVPSQRRHT